MEKILIVNLTNGCVEERPYIYEIYQTYGRGLALSLVREFVPPEESRYGEGNVIVLVPGLFAGCQAPSACRMIVATGRGSRQGMEVCNTTGNLPQKLGSLGIAAVVIRGKAQKKGTVIRISRDGVEVTRREELNDRKTSEIVRMLKGEYGQDCALIGAGKAADMRLSLSTFFCTYPDGEPEHHSPRNGFGDVFGAKNLRAVVVQCDSYFSRECRDKEQFLEIGKRIAQRIVADEVCGGALPAYGSITLLEILKDKNRIQDLTNRKKPAVYQEIHSGADSVGEADNEACSGAEGGRGKKVNYCCAPMCVVGCLNRHSVYEGERYSSPVQSEVMAALKNCFGFEDYELAKEIQDKASEIGIVGTEFVTAAKVYAEAEGMCTERVQTDHVQTERVQIEKSDLLNWLDEIEKGSLVGRVIASRTHGIARLYPEKENLIPLMDRKAIMDESLFDVKLERPYSGLDHMKDMDLLYAQIFVLENLGFCIFTSFALLDEKETFEDMAKMFTAKTGTGMSGEALIRHADLCIRREQEYEKGSWCAGIHTNIPPFTKVLYRYFGQRTV